VLQTYTHSRTDPPGALRGPLRGASSWASQSPRVITVVSSGPFGPTAGKCHWLLALRRYLKLHAVAPGGPPEGQCKDGLQYDF
jgi:hypothetical protein